jgi:hypothetical protein
MAQTYSTIRRDASDGRIYSSQYSRAGAPPSRRQNRTPVVAHAVPTAPVAVPPTPVAAPVLPAAPAAPTPQLTAANLPPQVAAAAAQLQAALRQVQAAAQQAPAPEPEPEADPGQSVTFQLSMQGLPLAAKMIPAGATGRLTVTGHPGRPYTVTGQFQGLRPLTDPAVRPVAWLIYDLRVPYDLPQADLAALPRGSSGTGNQPGALYTIDGNAPTYTPNCNTVSICISPGSFRMDGDGAWKLEGSVDSGTNHAFHPLVFLGPGALADINTPLPSGTVHRIMSDLFLHTATIHPELSLRSHFPQRLMTIVRDVLGMSPSPTFLSPDLFTRAAVTVEGLVRTTPSLMPSRETTFLLANSPIAG